MGAGQGGVAGGVMNHHRALERRLLPEGGVRTDRDAGSSGQRPLGSLRATVLVLLLTLLISAIGVVWIELEPR